MCLGLLFKMNTTDGSKPTIQQHVFSILQATGEQLRINALEITRLQDCTKLGTKPLKMAVKIGPKWFISIRSVCFS